MIIKWLIDNLVRLNCDISRVEYELQSTTVYSK